MEIAPHDLLRLCSPDDLVSQKNQPLWVYGALERAPYVVVRRARANTDMIAVGVRGQTRNERYAALLPVHAFTQRIPPEQLAQEQAWATRSRLSTSPALQVLPLVADILGSFTWGPVGSVGFELASEVSTTTESSDLDLIIRAPQQLPLARAQDVLVRLAILQIHVDIQVETSYGAFALNEYGRGATRVVLRTHDGPRLVHDPWSYAECSDGG